MRAGLKAALWVDLWGLHWVALKAGTRAARWESNLADLKVAPRADAWATPSAVSTVDETAGR